MLEDCNNEISKYLSKKQPPKLPWLVCVGHFRRSDEKYHVSKGSRCQVRNSFLVAARREMKHCFIK